MENKIHLRKIERTQFYWECPKCKQEIKGNGLKTLEHLKRLHEDLYCDSLKESEEVIVEEVVEEID